MSFDVGIIDTRKVIASVQACYGIDFNNWSMTFLRMRIGFLVDKLKMRTVDELVSRIQRDPDFFEVFLSELVVEVTELFRDPSLWRILKKRLASTIDAGSTCNIWVPECSSGEELYSLCIALKEDNLLDRVQIIATSMSSRRIEQAQLGMYELKREEISIANYERTTLKHPFEEYGRIVGQRIQMDTSLISNVQFRKVQDYVNEAPSAIRMVLFRNVLIYLNKASQNDVLNAMHRSLLPGGTFVIGIKEALNCVDAEKKFKVLNDAERIYQRIQQ